MKRRLHYPFIQSAGFTKAARARADVIVIHTMEAAEKPGTARAIAEWFAGKRGPAPKASAHFCLDQAEVIQCVELTDVAWHAPGANARGIGLEHAGYAKQTAVEWSDDASTAILMKSAELSAHLVIETGIPLHRLTVDELRAGGRGFAGHVDVSKAFGKSTHWDPGPAFPWPRYLELVEAALAGIQPDEEPTSPTSMRPPLAFGATGESARVAQHLLNLAGADPVLVEDGIFKSRSVSAVVAFQAKHGIAERSPSGAAYLGPETWAKLREVTSA